MATRYWVGGSGNWSSTAEWATTSGGAPGASVPLATDDVVFDANSGGNINVSVDGAYTCASLTITRIAAAGVITISISSSLTVNGAFTTASTAGNSRIWIKSVTSGTRENLILNGAVSISDCDFSDLIVTGSAAPISGTRLGNLTGCSGITFPAGKTVYWNLAGAQNWTADGWAPTSGGTPSTDYFPLAQDTAVFDNTGSVTGTITISSFIPYTGTVDMSLRTSAMTLSVAFGLAVYGNWINGSGITFSGASALTFSGRSTQSITTAGRTFTTAITIDSFGGSVQILDAFVTASNLTINNGSFISNGYSISVSSLLSNNANVREVSLGSSTVTITSVSSVNIPLSTNMVFNAGSSTINLTATTAITFNGGGLTYNNVNFTATSEVTNTINGANTFSNLTISAPASIAVITLSVAANQVITGTLTAAGATVSRRIFVRSSVNGTQRTLSVGTLSAQDCDFRDILITGAASGSAPTRAGDCGGNGGIVFPAAKTVYWNLAGAQNWSANGWATTSGGTPAVNNFPLAQDTAVFDDTGSVTGTIQFNTTWNLGTFDASARTAAMTIATFGSASGGVFIYKNWLSGTGVTITSAIGAVVFLGRGTQTITSNGVSFGCPISIDSVVGTVQLADALSISSIRSLAFVTGTFNAVSYNVTSGSVVFGTGTKTVKMGSGTWTLSGASGTVWNYSSTGLTFYKDLANIIISDTSANSRAFSGSGGVYNKLTIGGAAGASTVSISGANQFTELASTRTVAYTISLSNTQTVGAWTISGTAGNVVTFTGTGSIFVAGARVSGVDYLALAGTITCLSTSSGEFYAGANSTGGGAGIILTAAPAATTRYWVGGTGTWDATTTTNWSATSGGTGGASVPTSADAVVFDSLSNATAYTVTCTATQLRCASFTMAGPLSGNITWAGAAPLTIHDNVTLAATGITRTFNGTITFSGSSTGKTITTNGVVIGSSVVFDGVGCGWTAADAFNSDLNSVFIRKGSFDTGSYNITCGQINTTIGTIGSRTVNLGSSTVNTSGGVLLGTTENDLANLTFNSGTSQINFSSIAPTLEGNNQTFYNVSFTSVSAVPAITGVNIFNNLSCVGKTGSGVYNISVGGNQTINGTLTLPAGASSAARTFLQSNILGTPRTITCAAFSGTDVDFRDIAVVGAAAPISGTRLGDCKGNSGITFDAGKTVYYRGTGSAGWGSASWSATIGGTASAALFPLAQDTGVIPADYPSSGSTLTINFNYNIGTIDMSARTSNTITLATSTNSPTIYGDWINGTGTTISGSTVITFAGRTTQNITSAGKTFTQSLFFSSPGGSINLQDSLTIGRADTLAFWLTSGTFNSNDYNVSLTAGTLGRVQSDGTAPRTLNMGSGTWTLAANSTPWFVTASLTVTGTGTISLTSASSKIFDGGNLSYSGITINQGGAGSLTLSGNSTFANISNSYKSTGPTTIILGTTTQRVAQFTAAGESGRALTLSGTSPANTGTLIYTGGGIVESEYLVINNIRAYGLSSTWYAGTTSTNGGSLGWIFAAAVVMATSGFFLLL